MIYKLKLFIKLISKGFCIGSADIVPGVSGGTVAFILGIYPQLIEAIKSFNLDWLTSIIRLDLKGMIGKPHFPFLIPIGIGMISALFFFTRIVSLPRMIHTQPEIIYGFFFGLILGSIFLLFRHLGILILLRQLVLILSGVIFGGFIVMMIPTTTPNESWFIFLCGVIAISAMILPGISGSFILLMMKKYAYIFNAIGHFDFKIIIPFILGIIIGIVLFSRILSWLLKRFYIQMILFIIGLLIASLYIIWPFQTRLYEMIRGKERLISSVPYLPDVINMQVLSSLTMIIMGFILIIIFDRMSTEVSLIR